jgi:signal transduction histidine kinase
VRVLEASASREVLDLLTRHDVAVAIVDVEQPGMSGLDLAELMRGAAPTRPVPIIVLTSATPEPGRVLRGAEAGGIDVLVKPVDPHLLRSKVGVFIELSRQRLLVSAQVEQLHALQRTSELLMGVLDHDLRNPLNAIGLAAETLLLARPDDEMAVLIARRIRAASQRMSRLIAQGLDFAALRSGSWPIQARDGDLDQLCRTAASEFEDLNKRGFDCGVQGDPRGYWDPDRMLQLFSNLIGSALRHGAADVPIAVRIDGRSEDAVAIEVEHGGTLPESFGVNPFALTGETRGGAGLGLYIVDQIARAHGGGVIAEASGGRTVFTVRLPRRAGGA